MCHLQTIHHDACMLSLWNENCYYGWVQEGRDRLWRYHPEGNLAVSDVRLLSDTVMMPPMRPIGSSQWRGFHTSPARKSHLQNHHCHQQQHLQQVPLQRSSSSLRFSYYKNVSFYVFLKWHAKKRLQKFGPNLIDETHFRWAIKKNNLAICKSMRFTNYCVYKLGINILFNVF